MPEPSHPAALPGLCPSGNSGQSRGGGGGTARGNMARVTLGAEEEQLVREAEMEREC